MKRETLLVLAVLVVAVCAAVALLWLPAGESGRPLACFMHGGSNTGVCKS